MTRARDLAAGTFEQATGGVLKLETSDTTVTDGSVLGKIEFKAPDEASGTDAILVGAAIEAVAEGTFAADNNATELVFKTGASAAADAKMILDSSGNLLVGTTNTNTVAASGFTVQPDGQIFASSDSQQVLTLTRRVDNGEIVRFRSSDGSTVGSIGTFGGDAYFGTGDTGLIAYDNGNAILPFNTATGAYADNSLDFGVATQRFKNAYLSGGVYLGGTGAANLLQDYEEGTFTPALAYSTAGNSSFGYNAAVAHYVKVGDIVHFQLNVRLASFTKGTGSGNILVTGLPFTAHNTSGYANAHVSISLFSWPFSSIPIAAVIDNTATAALTTMSSNSATAALSDPDADSMVWLSGTYRAA
mgnify:CR=1 FL=1